MIPWLRNLFFDETSFVRAVRALVFILGAALHNGVIPGANGAAAWWLGPVVSGAALFLSSADKTPPELRKLAADLQKPILPPGG
jgi:hypothetical protein